MDGLMRTLSGRASRSKFSQEFNKRAVTDMETRLALETSTWKRRQVTPDLTVKEAVLPHHGSVIAKWLKDSDDAIRLADKKGKAVDPQVIFTARQKDAAEKFLDVYEEYLAVCGFRKRRSTSDFDRPPAGYDSRDPFDNDNAQRDEDIENAYKQARGVIIQSGSFGMMAVEGIVVENREMDSFRGDLRLALNALANLWKIR